MPVVCEQNKCSDMNAEEGCAVVASYYLPLLQTKNDWDAQMSAAIKLDDPDEAIEVLDELRTDRDLYIRKMRRLLKRTAARITDTNTALLSPVELIEHTEIARWFELEQDEIERLLLSWELEWKEELDNIIKE